MRSIFCRIGILSTTALAAMGDPMVLGVMEDLQCEDTQRVAARLMFVNVEDRWIAMNDEYYAPRDIHLASLQWNLASFGKQIGTVKLHDIDPTISQVNSREKLYGPEPGANVPVVINESGDFEG